MHWTFKEVSPLWLVRIGMSPTPFLCKLWKMFIFNSSVILACPCGDLPYACPAYYADKDSRRLSCGFLVPFLCIAPPSAETWLLNLARLLCFAWEPFSGPQSWSASRQKPSAIGGLTSFAFLLWGNTVLNCCCQMSCILSSCPVVYCGRASLEPITVIDKSTSPFLTLGISLSSL